MSVTPGARFTAVQPRQAASIGNQDGTAAPYTLLTVPAGKTYRLWVAYTSGVLGTLSTYTTTTGNGESLSITDSLGNSYAKCELFVTAPSQAVASRGSSDTGGVVLPPGTVVQLAVTGAPLTTPGLVLRMAGGIIWQPS